MSICHGEERVVAPPGGGYLILLLCYIYMEMLSVHFHVTFPCYFCSLVYFVCLILSPYNKYVIVTPTCCVKLFLLIFILECSFGFIVNVLNIWNT